MSLKTQAKPKWNMYDLVDNVENDLYDSLYVEYNDIQGVYIDYYVYLNDESTIDRLYGESTDMKYSDPYRTKMTYEPTLEPSAFQSFGMVSIDTIMLCYIPKTTFSRDVDRTLEPKPGDLVQTLWNNRTWEVIDMDVEENVFQLSNFAHILILKPFRYSDEQDDTKNLLQTDDSTLTDPLSAYGDNEWIEDESNEIEDYSDVDESIYGY